MPDIVVETARALRALWRASGEDSVRCEKVFQSRWIKFRESASPVCESVKTRFLGELCSDSYVLLNPMTAAITRSLWRGLRRHPDRKITQAELSEIIASALPQKVKSRSFSEYLLGALLLFGYLRPEPGAGGRLGYRVELGQATDECFRVQVFGFLSSVAGFNDVFGGALLVQHVPRNHPDPGDPWLAENQLQGRLVVVQGPFGIGKSVLTWRMAADFVLKGGLVLMHAPEQSLQECLYSLTSVDPDVDMKSLWYSTSMAHFRGARPKPGRGHLVFVTAEDLQLSPEAEESSAGGVFASFNELLAETRGYGLRVCMVDPINAYLDGRQQWDPHGPAHRSQTARFIRAAKAAGVNLWVTCEKSQDSRVSHYFEHLADTTIHLSRQANGEHTSDPFFEVIKSRFQSQLPGKHRLIIDSGAGLRIVPSLESFRKLLPSSCNSARAACKTGIRGLPLTLGPGGVKTGHIFVVTGPGKYKTVMGVHFLAGGWWPDECEEERSGCKPRSSRLMISDMPVSHMEEIAQGACGHRYEEFRARGLDFLQVPSGWADAGEVLSTIRDELVRRQFNGNPVERALVFTLSRLEETTPHLRNNDLFGVMLMRLLRSHGVTTFIVNSDERTYGTSRLRDVILEECDVRLDFERKHYYEREQTVIATIRTPASDHSRAFFCLNRTADGRLQVEVSPFRIFPEQDQLKPVPTSLFLLAETPNHVRYHERAVEALKSFRNPALRKRNRLDWESELLTQDPTLFTTERLTDDVQVVQLDEFELPERTAAPAGPLYCFPAAKEDPLIGSRYRALQERITTADEKSFFAVPYYFNCSFLALSRPELSKIPDNPFFGADGSVRSAGDWNWLNIQNFVERLEEERGLTGSGVPAQRVRDSLVFSCPVYDRILETYNSFFFEILHSLAPFSASAGPEDVLGWLGSTTAAAAMLCFRRVNRLSHRYFYKAQSKPKALINRHWYNTLNQELANWSLTSNDDLSIQPLPGGMTTWGEWYLAAPSYTHSPGVALEVIRFLCSENQENARRHEGVGLPTMAAFYLRRSDGSSANRSFSASPHCRLVLEVLGGMIEKGFRRSWIPGYCQIRSSISAHLLWILELPPLGEESERQQIADIMGSMLHEIRTVYSHQDWGRKAPRATSR